MIYQLPFRHRSPFTSHVVDLFLSIYGGEFSLVSAEDGLDLEHPSARLTADRRPGAVSVNNPPLRVAATDGMRFEFEVTDIDLKDWETRLTTRKCEYVW